MIRGGRSAIEKVLGLQNDEALLEEFRDDPKPLLEQMGVVFCEATETVFDAVYGDEHPHVVVEGPRGGGKTLIITMALGCRWVFKKDDVFHLAGSKEQAENGFAYVSNYISEEPMLAEFVEADLKAIARTRWGNWYKVVACSQTAVRSTHAGDAHREMGFVNHGGVLYCDEEAEIPDAIVDAARKTINTATPRKRVRSSTAHKTAGRFAQVINNPKRFGAHLIKYDVIDVVDGCRHDCRRCPMGSYFAGPLYDPEAVKGRRKKGEDFSQVVPEPTPEGKVRWAKWKKENPHFPFHEPAICGGRAKLHKPGHVSMENLMQEIRESQSLTADEVESFGRKRGVGGTVLNGAALEKCLRSGASHMEDCETWATADWGWNWTVAIIWQRQPGRVVPLEVYYLQHVPPNKLRAMFRQWAERLKFFEVYADSSHKHEMAELAEEGFEVYPVAFAEWKDFGVQWLDDAIRHGELAFPGEILEATDPIGHEGKYRFPSPGHEKLFMQMLGWKVNPDTGKIVKKDDHGPDSAICSAPKLRLGGGSKIEIFGSGRRESLEE